MFKKWGDAYAGHKSSMTLGQPFEAKGEIFIKQLSVIKPEIPQFSFSGSFALVAVLRLCAVSEIF